MEIMDLTDDSFLLFYPLDAPSRKDINNRIKNEFGGKWRPDMKGWEIPNEHREVVIGICQAVFSNDEDEVTWSEALLVFLKAAISFTLLAGFFALIWIGIVKGDYFLIVMGMLSIEIYSYFPDKNDLVWGKLPRIYDEDEVTWSEVSLLLLKSAISITLLAAYCALIWIGIVKGDYSLIVMGMVLLLLSSYRGRK